MYGFIKKAFTSYIYIYIRQQSYKIFFFLISFFFIINSVFAVVNVNTTSTLNSYDNANESGNGSFNTFNITDGTAIPITITAGSLTGSEYHLTAGLFNLTLTSTNGVSNNVFNITYTNFNSTSTMFNFISAAWSENDTATEENNNQLNLNNVKLNNQFTLYGLYTESPDVAKINNNSVTADTLTNDTGKDIWIYGSYIKSGDGQGNFADIKSSTFSRNAEIYGFSTGDTTSTITDEGDAKNNYVNIESSFFNYGTTNAGTGSAIYGAWTNKGNGNSNYVNIKNSKFEKDVGIWGFYIDNNGVANDNYAKIEGINTFNDNAYIYGTNIQLDGVANRNHVDIEGNNTFTGAGSYTDIAGSNINSNYYISSTTDGIANYNYVDIKGTNFFINETYIAGSNMYLKGVATGNYVDIEGFNTFNAETYIYGSNIGYDAVSYTGNGTAIDNHVDIKSITTFGADTYIYGSYMEYDGTATDNKVDIQGGNFFFNKASIYGSYIDNDGTAITNSAIVKSNTFSNITDIYGSCIAKDGTANGNFAEVEGNIFSSGRATIIGSTANSGAGATGNYVITKNNNFNDDASISGFMGGFNYSGIVENNYVNIIGINNFDKVTGIGGSVIYDGTANGNHVDIEGTNNIFNGYAQIYASGIRNDGDATGNSVNIQGTTTFNGSYTQIYGSSIANDGDATTNSVVIKGTTTTFSENADIFGSAIFYGDGTATLNYVKIENSFFNDIGGSDSRIYGAYSNEGTGNINHVNIKGSNFKKQVEISGFYINGDGTASTNFAEVEGNTFIGDTSIYGSHIENDGTATGNRAIVEGNNFSNYAFIYGSSAENNSGVDANQNYAITKNNTFNDNAYISGFMSGFNSNSIAEDNHVDIIGINNTFDKIARITGSTIYNGTATSNYVIIDGTSTFNDNTEICASCIQNDGTATDSYVDIKGTNTFNGSTTILGSIVLGAGNAENNRVIIDNGKFYDNADIYGVYAKKGKNNKITIENSLFDKNANIIGSYYDVDGDPFNVKENSIFISNTIFNGEANIYGAHFDATASLESTHNIITIGEDVVFNDKAYIYGTKESGTPIDIFTGNTLNLKSKISISDINNFEYLNLTLPTGFVKGDTGNVLITFDDAVNINYVLSNVKITLNVSKIPALVAGDKIVLLENLTGGGNIDISTATIESSDSRYKFELIQDSTNRLLAFLATITPIPVSNYHKSYSESLVASSSLVLQGFDEIADTSSFASLKPDANGIVIFSNAKGGKSRYETGSYIDLTGGNVYAGLGYKNKNLVFGAFAEFGAGSYKSHNEIDIIVKADGDLSYYGGGLLARIDFDNNIFFDTTFHIGQTTNTFSSNDIDTSTNSPTKFDTKSLYYGYSASLGYKFEIDEQNRIELFGRYLGHTRQKIKEVAPTIDGVKTGDVVEFDALNSNRVRVGGRYIYNFRNGFNMSFGGDYTIEFDGEQKARTNNKEIEAPTLKGSTASGKIGIGYNSDRFVFDLYGSNYFGVRNGFDGGAKFAYMFGDEPAPIKPVPLLNESFWAMGGIFKINSNQLLPPTKTKVLALSERIKGLKNQDYLILVIGHTDSTGKYAKNKKLSLARAISFRSELVKNGIDEKRIIAMGIADEAPIASNKTAAGREQNRRVEIEVVSKKEWENMDIDSELSKIKNKI
ncbi:MAG: hypothetical protein Ta2D_03060 [Rickettsiales bacterium]|nr:MAG: hypothetical protein Ta2D_03060 [Rickettsiales bacterium]